MQPSYEQAVFVWFQFTTMLGILFLIDRRLARLVKGRRRLIGLLFGIWAAAAIYVLALYFGNRPIFAAAEANDIEETRRLLLGNPELARSRKMLNVWENRTPLHVAAAKGEDAIATLLLDAGADVNANEGNEPPLFEAVFGGHVSTAKLLIERGANVNTIGLRNNTTPISVSIIRDDPAMTELLIRNGARIDIDDRDGENAFALANRLQRDDLLPVLTAPRDEPASR